MSGSDQPELHHSKTFSFCLQITHYLETVEYYGETTKNETSYDYACIKRVGLQYNEGVPQ